MYYSKNFKVGRRKQTNSAGQGEKDALRAPSMNKEVVTGQINIGLEEEMLKGNKQEGLSLSSKVIKNIGFGLNVRVRNFAMGIGGIVPARK
jgi:hypothetical protein